MNEYVRYRRWWMATVYMPYPQTETFNRAFEQHINNMTLYELMETLEMFDDSVEEPVAPVAPVVPVPTPIPYNPLGPIYPYTHPVLNITHITRCIICGLEISGAMGYVCNDQYCPTFMKVTC